MKNNIKIYYIIIEQFKTILKEHNLEDNKYFIIGLHMLEHTFKFCNLYNMPQLDTCKKAIYYYIEFILQLNEDIKLSKLNQNSVCIFIYNKLFTSQPEIKSKNNLKTINTLLQIINFYYTSSRDVEFIIKPLSKLNSYKLTVYNLCLPHLLYYRNNKTLFIKQHINFIKLIQQVDNKNLPLIYKKIFKFDNSIVKIKLEHFTYKL